MKLGVVGLPNVGKSTLFNAITKAGAEAANYPFCTIEPNTGVVAVPDERLDQLADMYNPKKKTPAVIEFVDIAGLVKGASRGEGLGNKFLSHIRECEAIVHVVRCFEDPDIIRHADSRDPKSDIETINLELIAADRETVAKRQEKAAKLLKSGEKRAAEEADLGTRPKVDKADIAQVLLTRRRGRLVEPSPSRGGYSVFGGRPAVSGACPCAVSSRARSGPSRSSTRPWAQRLSPSRP